MLERAKEILELEIKALQQLPLNSDIEKLVNLIIACKGKIIFTGMGKAGLVAKKIASTFSSTGTPSFFMHPGEAVHGDLGVLDPNDLVICMSNSGKTKEILLTISLIRSLYPTIKILGICGTKESPMGQACNFVLEIGEIKEPCPFGLAPTASTTAMIVIGDILSILIMEAKHFTIDEYGLRHHGGYIGEIISGKV